MIEIVALLAILGWAFTIWQFVQYVKHRDEQEQILLDRIQAPERVTARPVDSVPAKVSYVGEVPDNVSNESEAQAS